MADVKKNGERIFNIQMFGHFHISGDESQLGEEAIHSAMLIKLFAYVICHRGQNLSVQELIDILWPDDSSDNPAGALKNLMYRLRSVLKKQWPGTEFILTGRGAYSWNGDIDVRVDAEEFERLCKEGNAQKDRKRQIEMYKEAAELYKGMFLQKYGDEYWIASLSTYYHSLYLSVVKELSERLEQEGRFEEEEKICSDALKAEMLDEDIHCYFIRALIGQNKINLAKEQYQKSVNILYENLGIGAPEELQELYNELMKQTHEQEMDIRAIKAELKDDKEKGAFLCEYGIFKKTYHLELRRAERIGMSVYMSLLTVVPGAGVKKDSSYYLELMQSAMNKLEEVLLLSLRSGDVIAKYSGTQYIILLPTCQYETAKKVMERIEKNFFKKNRKLNVRLQYSLDEMS